jgi:hypothetical protein
MKFLATPKHETLAINRPVESFSTSSIAAIRTRETCGRDRSENRK